MAPNSGCGPDASVPRWHGGVLLAADDQRGRSDLAEPAERAVLAAAATWCP